jgi:hypothetical protein
LLQVNGKRLHLVPRSTASKSFLAVNSFAARQQQHRSRNSFEWRISETMSGPSGRFIAKNEFLRSLIGRS